MKISGIAKSKGRGYHKPHYGRPGEIGGSLPRTLPGGAKPLRGYGKKHNVYVLRVTPNIEGDLKRGWSGWMSVRDESLEELLTYYMDVESDELEAKWDKWRDPKHNPWHHRDTDDYQEFLEDYVEESGMDIRQDPRTKEWVSVHHEGLAAFPVEAASAKEAVEEAQRMLASDNPPGAGGWWGIRTIGETEPVVDLGDNWYLLGTEETEEIGFS